MLCQTRFTMKKSQRVIRCSITVISPYPARDPRRPPRKKAGGVSVLTKISEHIWIRPPSSRPTCPKNQSYEMVNAGCFRKHLWRNLRSHSATAPCGNIVLLHFPKPCTPGLGLAEQASLWNRLVQRSLLPIVSDIMSSPTYYKNIY